MSMATRLAVMNTGRVAQVGTPHEIYERPASRFVADFIGIANILEADGGWLAVRPEKIQVHLDEPPPGPNRMAGKVADIGYLGDWTTYLVELDSGRTIRAARANATRFVDRPVDWDDQVWLTFARDAGVVLTQ